MNERLDGGWPIPFHRDTDGLFCDLASEGAATGLLALMTGISEEYYCAGWMSGLEFACWEAREHGPLAYGMGEMTERQSQLLKLLSEEAGGWWYWTDDGPRFTSLERWSDHIKALKGTDQ